MNLEHYHKLEVINRSLLVDGAPFVVTFPDEELLRVEEGKIITSFRGRLENQWDNFEVEGYYA